MTPNASARRPPPAQQASPTLQLRSIPEYLLLIRLRWWWGLLLGLVVGLPLAWHQQNKPITYTASGSIIFQRDNQRILEMRAASDVDSGLRFHVLHMGSAAFLDRVAETFTEEEVALIQMGYIDPVNPSKTAPPSPRELLGRINLNTLPDLQIIRASTSGRTAEEPALLVNRLLDQFVRERAEQIVQTDTGALTFLRNQAHELRQRIEDAEKKFVEYRQNRNLVSIEDTQALITARMSTLTSAVTQIRTERLELEPIVRDLNLLEDAGGDLESLPRIQSDAQVAAARNELRTLEAEAAVLGQRYLERHPRMVENARRAEEAKERRKSAVAGAANALRSRLEDLNRREALLRTELTEATEDQLELDKASVELGVLRRQIDTDVRTLDRILEQISQQEIASQLAGANVRRWEVAGPGWGTGPDRTKILAMLVLLLVGCSVGIPVLLDLLDQRLKSSGDVETQLQASLVGEIPELKGFEKGSTSFLGADQTNDVFMESFRGIYSQLTLQNSAEGVRCMLVTSSIPGEGKSFITCNIAAVFAAHHKRTLIIDCDFRRPTQHTFLKSPSSPGAIQWIESESPLSSETPLAIPGLVEVQPNLWFLAAGGSTRHPTELLTHHRFQSLAKHLSAHFDVVIFDTPPVGLFPDALVVGKLCREAVFVAKFGAVNKGRIRTYLTRLRQTVAVFHGIIMNRMPENPTSPYYYKGYNYGAEKYVEYYKRDVA